MLDAIVVLPFVDRATLAARLPACALVLLPSEREGFGLPLVESLACGTPVVASDIPVLREVGGAAASYCPVADVDAWQETILRAARRARAGASCMACAAGTAGIARAAEFSWSRYTRRVAGCTTGWPATLDRRPRVAGGANGSARRWKASTREARPSRRQVLSAGAGGMERVLESLCLVSAGLVESQRARHATPAATTVREEVTNRRDGAVTRRRMVDVTRVGTLGAVGSVHVAPGFVAALRRSRADLIVLHEPNPWALLSYALARPPAPLAIWYHSDVVRPALQYALVLRPAREARVRPRRADRRVVASAGRACRALAPYRDRVSVIPFGIDPA